MNPPLVNNQDQMLQMFWKAGRKQQARELELTIRASDKAARIFSTFAEEQLDKYIGHSQAVTALKDTVRKLCNEDDPVLIIGPTGTGKELLARALHGSRSGAFVAINCTALPAELLESELFGHKKGAFTGATEDRPGKFKSAWGGTLFLDEIGDMPLDMQCKLLRVLQEKEFSALGDDGKMVQTNCRIVAATNRRDIGELHAAHFRDDLYYRLSTFVLKTQPLIERYEDIAEIVDSLGGHGLYTEFEKWMKEAEALATEDEELDNGDKSWLYRSFFQLEGNVRTLQAQVRRWQVLGVTR